MPRGGIVGPDIVNHGKVKEKAYRFLINQFPRCAKTKPWSYVLFVQSKTTWDRASSPNINKEDAMVAFDSTDIQQFPDANKQAVLDLIRDLDQNVVVLRMHIFLPSVTRNVTEIGPPLQTLRTAFRTVDDVSWFEIAFNFTINDFRIVKTKFDCRDVFNRLQAQLLAAKPTYKLQSNRIWKWEDSIEQQTAVTQQKEEDGKGGKECNKRKPRTTSTKHRLKTRHTTKHKTPKRDLVEESEGEKECDNKRNSSTKRQSSKRNVEEVQDKKKKKTMK